MGPPPCLLRLIWRVGHPALVGWMCCLGSRLLGKRVGSTSWLTNARSSPFPIGLAGALDSPRGHGGGRRVGFSFEEPNGIVVGPGLWAGAGLWGSIWDISFFPASIHLLPKPSLVNSHSSFLAFNRPPLHLRGFGAEKALPRLCVDVCHGPKGCPGPRLSSAASPLPGDHGPCWSAPQGLLPGSFGDSCPIGDLRALREQGKAREMERTMGVPSGTPGSGPVGPQLSRPVLPPRLLVRNLVRLVLLWVWPNPAQGQQLALGANCCTALARPAMCAGGAARPGLVPATSRLLARGT